MLSHSLSPKQRLLIYHRHETTRAVALTYDNLWENAGFSGTDAAIMEIGKLLVDSGRFEVTVVGYIGDADTYVDAASGIRFQQWSTFNANDNINNYDWYCPLFFVYDTQHNDIMRQISDKKKTKVLVWLHTPLWNDVILQLWKQEHFEVYVMAVSQWVYDMYIVNKHLDADHLWLVPNGVSPRFYQNGTPEKKERGMWCFHSRFNRGGLVSARVFDQVRYRCPDVARSFQMVSYDVNDHRESTPSFVQCRGSMSKTELAALLGKCEYFVYPLVHPNGEVHHDTFGCVIMEALAMGVIVVTWNVACIPKLYGDYVVALPPPSNYPTENRWAAESWFLSEEAVAQLADAVVAIEADPERKTELRRSGMTWARQQTWDIGANTMLTRMVDPQFVTAAINATPASSAITTTNVVVADTTSSTADNAPPSFLKRFLSVCTCIKNERPYMAEFIRHYLAQGVDHMYIIDNGSTDGGIETLPECSDAATVTIIRDARDFRVLDDETGPVGQKKMMTENLFERLRNETQWAIIVDADEFMFGKNGHTLKTYVQTVPDDVNRVYVLWNIMSHAPCSDPAQMSETFHLGQNQRRINYDKFYSAHVSNLTRYCNCFGKSIFRPMQTDIAHGLSIHKIFVHGRAVTNYGQEDHASTWFEDRRPVPAYSEDSYQKLDVSMHHYALRNRADCAKKSAQLTDVPSRIPFITALFELLRGNDPEAFVIDYALPAAAGELPTRQKAMVVRHSMDLPGTSAASITGYLDALQVVDVSSGGRTVHIAGWALSIDKGSNRRVRYVHQKTLSSDNDDSSVSAVSLDVVQRDDVAQAFGGNPQLALCGWNQHIICSAHEDRVPGWLEMNIDGEDDWVRFMDIVI